LNNAELGLKTQEGSGKVFYVSSTESKVLTTEWLCDRIVHLLESNREDEACALIKEWEQDGGGWVEPE